MAATNHTTNYNLPQYIGTDKPTYLGDWNSTMGAIDTQMKTNADNASGALSAAQTAQTNANSALSTAQGADTKADTAITNAAAAQTSADNASSVASSALSTANTANTNAQTAITNAAAAQTSADTITSRLNLSSITTYGINDVTVSSGTLSQCNLTLATNADGSLFKLYGIIAGTGVNKVTITTSLRPEAEYTVSPAGIDSGTFARDFTVKTNGNIEISAGMGTASRHILLFPCLYWNTDFNDEPIPNNQ